MAVTKQFLEEVLRDLSKLGTVEARRMFGGYGLYQAGLFFGLCSRDVLYFRVDEAGRAECVAGGVAAFDPISDGRGSASYFEVAASVRSSKPELRRWFERALAEAARKKPKPKGGLSALRNIGPVSRRRLAAIGLRSLADLEARGAVDVWLAVRENEPRVSVNLLYALEGARTNRRWTELPRAERDSLKQRAGMPS